jgi:predicted MFS family arabinose efflux permease
MAAKRTIALVTLASGIGNGFGRFTFPALLPAMKLDVLGSYSAAGFIGTANVGAYLLGALLVMVVSLRRPPHQILVAGLACSTVGMFVLAAAQSLLQLSLGMTLAGIGGASIFIPSPGIVGAVVPANRRGFTVGLVNAGIGAATVLGTQLARFSPDWWGPHGWRWVWAILGVLSLATFVAVLVLLRPATTGTVAAPRLAALREAPGWLPYTVGYFLFGFGYIIVITYTVASLREEGGFAVGHAANVYAGLAVGIAVGGIVLGRLSDRVGRRLAMLVGYAGTALCPLAMLVHREPLASLAAVAFGVLFSGSVAVVATYLTDVVDRADFGPAFAAVTIAFSLAQAAGPQVGGTLRDHTGSFAATFLVSAASLGGATLAAAVLLRTAGAGRRPDRMSAAPSALARPAPG